MSHALSILSLLALLALAGCPRHPHPHPPLPPHADAHPHGHYHGTHFHTHPYDHHHFHDPWEHRSSSTRVEVDPAVDPGRGAPPDVELPAADPGGLVPDL